jgi:predicted MPP superfamily phosphohydrolase
MTRKAFVKSFLGLSAGSLLTVVYTFNVEPYWVEFVNVKMPIKNLPKHLEGKTLMQISDIHVGNKFDYNFIIQSFIKAQKLKPDIVVYTGDYVSYENKEQFKQLEEVMKSSVKGNLGTVGILGNHDYGYKWSNNKVALSICKILERNNIKVLRNSSDNVSGLNIIGIDDYWATNFRPSRALSNYNKRKANLVLCHNPDVCDLNVWSGYKGWILSGHTHGGQCKPPFLAPPILPVKNKKYTCGMFELNDGRTLYINRALGNSKPVRFNVRPEITIFTMGKA